MPVRSRLSLLAVGPPSVLRWAAVSDEAPPPVAFPGDYMGLAATATEAELLWCLSGNRRRAASTTRPPGARPSAGSRGAGAGPGTVPRQVPGRAPWFPLYS